MSLDPNLLDIGVATATYYDMLQMVEDEKKLRKNLLDWVSLREISNFFCFFVLILWCA